MLVPLKIPPGFVQRATAYDAKGRWSSGDKVIVRDGKIEKWGGFSKLTNLTVAGLCRGLHTWLNSSASRFLAIGTHTKLYLYASGALANITPASSTGSLSNPFSIASGSRSCTVTHVGHGRVAGGTVNFSGANPIGNLYFDGDYTVETVVDANSYTILHPVATATSTVSGGGGTVSYEYEISPGLADNIDAFGFGVGSYGSGKYGTPRTTSVSLLCRTWTLGNRGGQLIASHQSGSIYEWESGDDRAAIVANAPTNNTGIFITEEKHIVALGAGGSPLKAKWCDPDDITLWTEGDLTNEAGAKTLQSGNRLVAGLPRKNLTNLLWTDTDLYLMRYEPNSDDVFSFQQQGSGVGAAGPHAVIEHMGVVYWMGLDDFYAYNGYPYNLPPDVRDYVFSNINRRQLRKCYALKGTINNLVGWLYCSSGSDEIDRYALYFPAQRAWVTGTYDRTAWVDSPEFGVPIAVSPDGVIFQHETGYDADGDPLNAFVVLAPTEIRNGEEYIELNGVIPDIDDQVGELQLTALSREYPQDKAIVREGPYPMLPTSGRVDTRASGRQIGVEIRSNVLGGFFRLGTIRLDVAGGGARR